GPRRTCSNGANCPVVQKPELAAPGQGIFSSFSVSAANPNIKDTRLRDPDGVHSLLQGTSMSAPHVTGAAALLLAWDAGLTSEDVKSALTGPGKTNTDFYTGGTPNDTWGAGKLAVNLAIAGVGMNPPPDPATPVPSGVAAAAGFRSATISWTQVTGDV